jgi:hypothetical protein
MKRKNTIKSRRTVDNLSILDKDLLSPTNSSRKQIPFPLKDKGKIHYSTLNYNFNEMKKFIYLEIKKLRKDLQRIATLLHAKT